MFKQLSSRLISGSLNSNALYFTWSKYVFVLNPVYFFLYSIKVPKLKITCQWWNSCHDFSLSTSFRVNILWISIWIWWDVSSGQKGPTFILCGFSTIGWQMDFFTMDFYSGQNPSVWLQILKTNHSNLSKKMKWSKCRISGEHKMVPWYSWTHIGWEKNSLVFLFQGKPIGSL